MKAQTLRAVVATQPRFMRSALLFCAVAVSIALFLPGQRLPAQDGRVDRQLVQKLNQQGDITLRNTTLSDALLTVSETWRVNIVVGDDVQGMVTGSFNEAPLHEILDSILQSQGYTYRPVGKSLVVSRSNDGQVHPLFQTATIKLRAAKPEEIIDAARLFASPKGRVQSVPSANSLIVFDFAANIARIQDFVTQIDNSAVAASGGGSTTALLQVQEFSPQYVPVESLKPVLEPILSIDGKIGVMPQENRLVVVDHANTIELIRCTIARLDTPRPQVRITAFIYDISIEDLERLGVNWSTDTKWDHDAAGNATGLLGIESLMQAPAAAGDPTSTLTLMNLSRNIDVTGVIEALTQLSNARLLADPSITVIDRESASIQIVTEIPFQQLTQTGQGGNIGTVAFREAGVTLNVTPRIANDGTIELDVNPAFSRLAGFTSGTTAQPIIDKRETDTTVRVIDGQTLVIGGLRQRDDIRERRGVPYLMNHRFIGKLFRAYEDTVKESELVVFITPEIITPQKQGRPREWANINHGESVLERIPVAPVLESPYLFDDCVEAENSQWYESFDGELVHPQPEYSPAPAVEQLPTPEGGDILPPPSEGIVQPAMRGQRISYLPQAAERPSTARTPYLVRQVPNNHHPALPSQPTQEVRLAERRELGYQAISQRPQEIHRLPSVHSNAQPTFNSSRFVEQPARDQWQR